MKGREGRMGPQRRNLPTFLRAVRHQESRPNAGTGLLAANPSSRTDQRLDTDRQPAPPALTVTGGRDGAPAYAGEPVPAATTFRPSRRQVDWGKASGLLLAVVFIAGFWLAVLHVGGVL